MFRPAARSVARAVASKPRSPFARTTVSRRWASTVPADRSRSWKSSFVRWGLAGAVVYYYNTTNIFADENGNEYAQFPPPSSPETEVLPTLESYSKKPKALSLPPSDLPQGTPELNSLPEAAVEPSGDASDLEAEASQQGAFNEETGEINWDCPCLGGMAHGPCGENFRAAFSCFVFSKEEPKGVDCIDKFKDMQDCFRQHPDVYGAELEDDEEGAPIDIDDAPTTASKDANISSQKTVDLAQKPAQAATTASEPISVSEELVPKAWHDDSASNAKSNNTKSKASDH